MGAVSLDEDVHGKLRLLAKAWRINEGGVVRRLLDEFEDGANAAGLGGLEPDGSSGSGNPDESGVPIYLIYEGTRIDATFDPGTHGIQIQNGPLAGRKYRSPSGAAVAVIAKLNPSVNPSRNGWGTWLVTETGMFLQTIRRPRGG